MTLTNVHAYISIVVTVQGWSLYHTQVFEKIKDFMGRVTQVLYRLEQRTGFLNEGKLRDKQV